MSTLRCKPIWACLLSLFSMHHAVSAAGVVTNCTEANLRAALTGGGTVTFACDGTITLASQLTIASDTTLDATGHNVVVSGGNSVRLFDVNPGASLTLMNLTLANGRHQGFNGATGADGGEGSGGAINVDSGTLNLIGCRIWTNTVVGGAGGNGNPNGSGGPALGGAIYLFHGTLNATNSEFVGNMAIGGPGGTNSSVGVSGSGGQAWGGAIASSGGLLQLDNCSFASNSVKGGLASLSSSLPGAGASGEASGGAWFNDAGTAVVTRCSFVLNSGSTPVPPPGITSGSGGTVRGGSICTVAGPVSIIGTEFINNRASGGNGVRTLGTGGPGQGGAICNLGGLELTGCLMQNNSAGGGNNGLPAGDGLGGAIFNGGQLKVARTELVTNTVQAGQGYAGGTGGTIGGIARGGAIFTTNALALSESTLTGNVANGATGGIKFGGPYPAYPAYGGAIYNSGTSDLTNNTLTANVANGGTHPGSPLPPHPSSAGGDAYGGGIYQAGGTAFLLNNTVAANAAQGGTGHPNGNSYGGGIANQGGSITLLNTIVANSSSGSNSFGTLTDAGHNLSSDASCTFTNTGGLNNTDPKLGPLANYGGPTPTMPLLSGSPAMDGGNGSSFPTTDQRGRSRPYGSTTDIGAFESSPPYVIRGQVSGFTLADEVQVAGGATTAVTTHHGVYSLETLAAGEHAVTPSSADYLFVPDNHLVTVGADQLGVNFTAYHWNALSLDGISNSLMLLRYAGTNGHAIRLLTSSNLVHWAGVSTNLVGSGNLVEFQVPVALETPKRFYRTAQE